MPELLRIQTPHFELSIWCTDISKRKATYDDTMSKRQAFSTEKTHRPTLRISPPILDIDVSFMGEPLDADKDILQSAAETKILLNEPVFFENVQYQFEWLFFTDTSPISVNNAYLTHRSHLINEGFRFAEAHRSLPARLTGSVNTANHLGWMRLPLEYITEHQTHRYKIAFEVLPTKMSLHDDLPAMYHTIDRIFPLWRFSLVAPTEQEAGKGQQRNYFPLLWLANFTKMRNQLEHGLKVISQAPHSRLQPHLSYNKAARLKGKIPHRLGTKIKEDFNNGRHDKSYPVVKKQLSVDTPENRFIKMVVNSTIKRLSSFEQKLRAANAAPENQRLSDAFLKELHSWQQPLQKTLKHRFMQEVGRYQGLSHESLVLQQKSGYSLVYRIWQDLKFYLDVFDNQTSVSMKSVAEIYEVWCFLMLRNILIDELGFQQVSLKKPDLTLNNFLEYQLKDGFAGAITFKRDDGVTARLAHEPSFGKKGAEIRSYLTTQRPDIVLEVTLPIPEKPEAGEAKNTQSFIWIFDAKYRIKTPQNSFDIEPDVEHKDYVPDDAINQMHRYRDALIRIITDDRNSNDQINNIRKSRPVVGAFALYPGYFDQVNMKNPYQHEIDEVGIGAFALLPNVIFSNDNTEAGELTTAHQGHHWLSEFLIQQIGKPDADLPTQLSLLDEVDYGSRVNHIAERLYVQEPARIPYSGMNQTLYPDLTLTVALANKKGRIESYFNNFEQDVARWYHIPESTFLRKYQRHVINELSYLALATNSDSADSKEINKLWPIKDIRILPRNEITIEQAGSSSRSTKLYYLFELGKPLTLTNPIKGISQTSFMASMSLTTLASLEQVSHFSQLKQVYQKALAKS